MVYASGNAIEGDKDFRRVTLNQSLSEIHCAGSSPAFPTYSTSVITILDVIEMWTETLAVHPGLTENHGDDSMKYLMLILMVFSFSFAVHALKADNTSIDYGDITEVQDFALPGDLVKVPITNTSQVFVKPITASLRGHKNTADTNGDSLPYEVGWQSTETI